MGLRFHEKISKPIAVAVAVAALVPPETDLHAKIDNSEKIIDKLTENQLPSTTINAKIITMSTYFRIINVTTHMM